MILKMNMTLEQKIGQLLMIGWQSNKVEDIIEIIKNYHFGNIILFTRNIKNANHLKEMTKEIQEAAIKFNSVPAFIAIDQEGGNVRRIYDGVTRIPGHMAIGAASFNRPQAANEVGHILAGELKDLGVNMVLAPIADVNSNPQNPIIAIRAFSDDPHYVSKLASEMSQAIQEEGVLSTYKHFIGHGDVSLDSHLDLPYVNKNIDELKHIELIPYMGNYLPDAIMIAHILYKKLDDRFPASISYKIINDLLRKEIGYEGLVVSDCFEMEALSRAFSLDNAGIFAVNATSDISIISHSFGKQLTVRNSLLKAVNTGKVTIEQINQSLARILKYKEKYCFEKETISDLERNQEVADAISLASITLAHGTPFEIDENTIVVGVTNYLQSFAEDANVENIDVAKVIGETFSIPYFSIDSKKFNLNEVQSLVIGKKIILALSDSHLTLVQKVLYTNLVQSGERIMLISLRTPYDVLDQSMPECHICLYEYTQLSIQSLIRVLKGNEAKGKLPVKIDKDQKVHKGKGFLIDNIIEYIDKNYSKQITLASVADEFLITREHLCRIFKAKHHITFLSYLNQVRISKVKHLLLTTNLRINEIANLCGYFDINYFNRLFKKSTGATPSYFRDNHGYYDKELSDFQD